MIRSSVRRAWLLVGLSGGLVLTGDVQAADEYRCGSGGKPNKATKRCDCPTGKVESTIGGISKCVDSTPKPKAPAPESKCPSGSAWSGGGCVPTITCPPDTLRVGSECMACPTGTHLVANDCVPDPKPDKVDVPEKPPVTSDPSQPTAKQFFQRWCLLDHKERSYGCFSNPKRCEEAVSKIALVSVTCKQLDEVACFVRDDGVEICQPTLDGCRSGLLAAKKTHGIKRHCAVQNATVGVPTTVPEWTPPDMRTCLRDDLGQTFDCYVLPVQCEAARQPLANNGSKIGRSYECRTYSTTYCYVDGEHERQCMPTLPECRERKLAVVAHSKSNPSPKWKIEEGCKEHGPKAVPTDSDEGWTVPDSGYCLVDETGEAQMLLGANTHCSPFRHRCQISERFYASIDLKGLGPVACEKTDPLHCLTIQGVRDCYPTMDQCHEIQSALQEKFALEQGCTTIGTGVTPVPGDPVWTPPSGRWCMSRGDEEVGCDHPTERSCKKLVHQIEKTGTGGTGWKCTYASHVACFYARMQTSSLKICAASVDSCNKRRDATMANNGETIKVETPCEVQGEEGGDADGLSVTRGARGCHCEMGGAPTASGQWIVTAAAVASVRRRRRRSR